MTGGIAIAIDDISMLLAYKLFEFAQMADGQESSTRYIEFSMDGLPEYEDLGLPAELKDLWATTMSQGFDLYHIAKNKLEVLVKDNPEAARIPKDVPVKVKERMLKNYALDRSRYFLPFACKTGVAIVATARIWADIIKSVDSLDWKEADAVAILLREELNKVAPNLIRHSYSDQASQFQTYNQAKTSAVFTTFGNKGSNINYHNAESECRCNVEVLEVPSKFSIYSTEHQFTGKTSRYSQVGIGIKRQTVRVEWSGIAIAELRDLNRHRTGFRFSDLIYRGLYIPWETIELLNESEKFKLDAFLKNQLELVCRLAEASKDGFHPYGYFLGTQVAFEHTQQGDKFLYEVELRTGVGAHFRYAEHLKQAAELYFEKCPYVREHIKIGQNEPE